MAENARLISVISLSRWQKFPPFPRCHERMKRTSNAPKIVKNESGDQRGNIRSHPKPRIPNAPDQSAGNRHINRRFFLNLMELWSSACT